MNETKMILANLISLEYSKNGEYLVGVLKSIEFMRLNVTIPIKFAAQKFGKKLPEKSIVPMPTFKIIEGEKPEDTAVRQEAFTAELKAYLASPDAKANQERDTEARKFITEYINTVRQEEPAFIFQLEFVKEGGTYVNDDGTIGTYKTSTPKVKDIFPASISEQKILDAASAVSYGLEVNGNQVLKSIDDERKSKADKIKEQFARRSQAFLKPTVDLPEPELEPSEN